MSGNRLWVIGAVLAIVAIAVLGWFLGIGPKLAEAVNADLEHVGIDQLNVVQEQRLGTLREQFESLEELEAELQELAVELPASPAVDEFADFLTQAVADSGVTLRLLTASEPAPYGLAVAVPGEPPGAAGAGFEGIYAVAFTVEVEGGAEAVTRFSERVQLGPRLTIIQNFAFVASEEKSTGTLTGYLLVVTDPASSTG